MGPGRHPRLPPAKEAPMLPYATPAIRAQLDPYEDTERDTLRAAARRRLDSPAPAGARIALALCEIEAGMRSPLQLERLCHLTIWPKLAERLRRSGGPAVTGRSLVRVIAQEHTPRAGRGHRAGAPRRPGGAGGDATGRRQGSLGTRRTPILTPSSAWRGTHIAPRQAQSTPAVSTALSTTSGMGGCRRGRPDYRRGHDPHPAPDRAGDHLCDRRAQRGPGGRTAGVPRQRRPRRPRRGHRGVPGPPRPQPANPLARDQLPCPRPLPRPLTGAAARRVLAAVHAVSAQASGPGRPGARAVRQGVRTVPGR